MDHFFGNIYYFFGKMLTTYQIYDIKMNLLRPNENL